MSHNLRSLRNPTRIVWFFSFLFSLLPYCYIARGHEVTRLPRCTETTRALRYLYLENRHARAICPLFTCHFSVSDGFSIIYIYIQYVANTYSCGKIGHSHAAVFPRKIVHYWFAVSLPFAWGVQRLNWMSLARVVRRPKFSPRLANNIFLNDTARL